MQKTDSLGKDNTITLFNSSKNLANVGFGMDGSLVANVADVADNENIIFKITPTYYFNGYEGLKIGEVVSSVGLIGKTDPQLKFPSEKFTATVTLTQDGPTLSFQEVIY